jgi:hypothetical protein
VAVELAGVVIPQRGIVGRFTWKGTLGSAPVAARITFGLFGSR